MSASEKFQAILDARGFKVRGSYVGGYRVAISGEPAEVEKARKLIRYIYTEDKVLDLPAEEGLAAERIVWFQVPQIAEDEDARPIYEKAVAAAKADGYA